MALQSRFGTDERFRMDSRFLEEAEDKEEESGEAMGGGTNSFSSHFCLRKKLSSNVFDSVTSKWR